MAAFTNVDTASINKGGVLAFEASPLAADLVSSIAAKDADVANAALGSVKSLCEDVDQWVEPYLVECLPAILEALADKKTVEAANVAGTAILVKSSPNSIRVVTSLIYESFTSLKWQTKTDVKSGSLFIDDGVKFNAFDWSRVTVLELPPRA